ncbi:MAG: type II toxin-antitoxin system CcdA family antitoxin [Parvularculaceae bacterium]
MPNRAIPAAAKRRSVNLTLSEDVVSAAKRLGLNASQAAEAGIRRAIAEKQAEQWLSQNRSALQAHNARIEKAGTLLTPDWAAQE